MYAAWIIINWITMNEEQIEKASHIASLITKRIQQTISNTEQAELQEWLNKSGDNYLLYDDLMTTMNESLEEYQQYDTRQAFKKLVTKLSVINKINPANIAST